MLGVKNIWVFWRANVDSVAFCIIMDAPSFPDDSTVISKQMQSLDLGDVATSSSCVATDLTTYQSILADLDLEVEMRCEQLQIQAQVVRNNLQRKFMNELNNLPKEIRQMKLRDFITIYGGDASQFSSEVERKIQTDFDSWVQDIHTPRKSARKAMSVKKAGNAKATSLKSQKSTRSANIAKNISPSRTQKFSVPAEVSESDMRSQTQPFSTPRYRTRSALKMEQSEISGANTTDSDINSVSASLNSTARQTRSTRRAKPKAGTQATGNSLGVLGIQSKSNNKFVVVADESFNEQMKSLDAKKKNKVQQMMANLQKELGNLMSEVEQ